MHSNAHSTVLVVDDHPIVREGIRVLVDGHAGFTVVGEASTAREAIERLRTLKPALLTVDLSLGQGSGFEVLEALRVMDGGAGPLHSSPGRTRDSGPRSRCRRLRGQGPGP